MGKPDRPVQGPPLRGQQYRATRYPRRQGPFPASIAKPVQTPDRSPYGGSALILPSLLSPRSRFSGHLWTFPTAATDDQPRRSRPADRPHDPCGHTAGVVARMERPGRSKKRRVQEPEGNGNVAITHLERVDQP